MNWDTIKTPLLAGIISVLSALAGGSGGVYYATAKPAEPPTPAAQLQKAAAPLLQIVNGMTGLCIRVETK